MLTLVALACAAATLVGATQPGESVGDPAVVGDAEPGLTSVVPLVVTQELSPAALEALERVRQQAEAAARTNAEWFGERLRSLEQTLMGERGQELAELRQTNRALVLMVGALGGLGLVGMMAVAWCQLRAMRRFTEVAASLPSATTLSLIHPPSPGETRLVGGSPAEQSSARFLGTLERLEQRIHELEHTAATTAAVSTSTPAEASAGVQTGDPQLKSLVSVALARAGAGRQEACDRAALLLGKGQALLNLGQAEAAIACFDEVLGLDGKHAEALLRKGAALERLKRLEEALECYDRAIALDHSQTMAYLHKGAVCNRLARFSEALACYEQALRAQKEEKFQPA